MSRRTVLALALLALLAEAAQAQLAVRVGLDLEGQMRNVQVWTEAGDVTVDGSDDPDAYDDAHPGLTVAAEYLLEVERFFLLGAGLQVQPFRALQSAADPNPGFTYVPAYLTLRMPLSVEGVTMGPVGRLGYGLFLANDELKGSYESTGPGLYWAAGLTMQLGSGLFADVVYARNYGTFKRTVAGSDTVSTDRYSAVEVGLGYRF